MTVAVIGDDDVDGVVPDGGLDGRDRVGRRVDGVDRGVAPPERRVEETPQGPHAGCVDKDVEVGLAVVGHVPPSPPVGEGGGIATAQEDDGRVDPRPRSPGVLSVRSLVRHGLRVAERLERLVQTPQTLETVDDPR